MDELANVWRGARISLRPLRPSDYGQWIDVRTRCREWLSVWEPKLQSARVEQMGKPGFELLCRARDEDSRRDFAYGFGVFLGDRFLGEVNLSGVQRGPLQNCTIGYWIDQDVAGNGYIPEAVVVAMKFAFEEAKLHRVQISILPRNQRSRRVVEKLGIAKEGLARRYVEINGVWEDHFWFAITYEEWVARRQEFITNWITR